MAVVSAPDEVQRLRALAHPLRLDMLSLLTGTALSAAEVARELDVTQANASYHLRLLHAAGLLVVAGEEKVNGGTAKRYRHLWDQAPPRRANRSDADVEAEVLAMAEAAARRVRRRRKGVTGHYTDADLWVDPQVWRQVVELLEQASGLLHAAAQPPRSPGTLRAGLSVLAFEQEPGRSRAGRS